MNTKNEYACVNAYMYINKLTVIPSLMLMRAQSSSNNL